MPIYPVIRDVAIGNGLEDARLRNRGVSERSADLHQFCIDLLLPEDVLVGRIALRSNSGLGSLQIDSVLAATSNMLASHVHLSQLPSSSSGLEELPDHCFRQVMTYENKSDIVVVSERAAHVAVVLRFVRILFSTNIRSSVRCLPTRIVVEGFPLSVWPHGSRAVPLLNLATRLEVAGQWLDASQALFLSGLAVLNARRFVQCVELFHLSQAMIVRSLPENMRPDTLISHKLSCKETMETSWVESCLAQNQTCAADLSAAHGMAARLELLCADSLHQHGDFVDTYNALFRFVVFSRLSKGTLDVGFIMTKGQTQADGSVVALQPHLLSLLLFALADDHVAVRLASARVLQYVVESLGCDMGPSVKDLLLAVFKALSDPRLTTACKDALLKTLEAVHNLFPFFSRCTLCECLSSSIVPALLAVENTDVRLNVLRTFSAVLRFVQGEWSVDWRAVTVILKWADLDQNTKSISVGGLSRKIWSLFLDTDCISNMSVSSWNSFLQWTLSTFSLEFATFSPFQRTSFLHLVQRISNKCIALQQELLRLKISAFPLVDADCDEACVFEICSQLSFQIHGVFAEIPVRDHTSHPTSVVASAVGSSEPKEDASVTRKIDMSIDLLAQLWVVLQQFSTIFNRSSTVDEILSTLLAQCTNHLRSSSPSKRMMTILLLLVRSLIPSAQLVDHLRQFVIVFAQWIPLNIHNEAFDLYLTIFDALLSHYPELVTHSGIVERTVEILSHHLTVRSKAYRGFRNAILRCFATVFASANGDENSVAHMMIRRLIKCCMPDSAGSVNIKKDSLVDKVVFLREFFDVIRSSVLPLADHEVAGSRPSSASGRYRTPRGSVLDLKRISSDGLRVLFSHSFGHIVSSCKCWLSSRDSKLHYEMLSLLKNVSEVVLFTLRESHTDTAFSESVSSWLVDMFSMAVDFIDVHEQSDPEAVFLAVQFIYALLCESEAADFHLDVASELLQLVGCRVWSIGRRFNANNWRNLRILFSYVLEKQAVLMHGPDSSDLLEYVHTLLSAPSDVDGRMCGLRCLYFYLLKHGASEQWLAQVSSAVQGSLLDGSKDVRKMALCLWQLFFDAQNVNPLRNDVEARGPAAHSVSRFGLYTVNEGAASDIHGLDAAPFFAEVSRRRLPRKLWDDENEVFSSVAEDEYEDASRNSQHSDEEEADDMVHAAVDPEVDDEFDIIEDDDSNLDNDDSDGLADPYGLDDRVVYEPSESDFVVYRGRKFSRVAFPHRRAGHTGSGSSSSEVRHRRRLHLRTRRASDTDVSNSTEYPDSPGASFSRSTVQGGHEGPTTASDMQPFPVALDDLPDSAEEIRSLMHRQRLTTESHTSVHSPSFTGASSTTAAAYSSSLSPFNRNAPSQRIVYQSPASDNELADDDDDDVVEYIGDDDDDDADDEAAASSPEDSNHGDFSLDGLHHHHYRVSHDLNHAELSEMYEFRPHGGAVSSTLSEVLTQFSGSSSLEDDQDHAEEEHGEGDGHDQEEDFEGDQQTLQFNGDEQDQLRHPDEDYEASSSSADENDTEYLYVEGGLDVVSSIDDNAVQLPPGIRVGSPERVDYYARAHSGMGHLHDDDQEDEEDKEEQEQREEQEDGEDEDYVRHVDDHEEFMVAEGLDGGLLAMDDAHFMPQSSHVVDHRDPSSEFPVHVSRFGEYQMIQTSSVTPERVLYRPGEMSNEWTQDVPVHAKVDSRPAVQPAAPLSTSPPPKQLSPTTANGLKSSRSLLDSLQQAHMLHSSAPRIMSPSHGSRTQTFTHSLPSATQPSIHDPHSQLNHSYAAFFDALARGRSSFHTTRPSHAHDL